MTEVQVVTSQHRSIVDPDGNLFIITIGRINFPSVSTFMHIRKTTPDPITTTTYLYTLPDIDISTVFVIATYNPSDGYIYANCLSHRFKFPVSDITDVSHEGSVFDPIQYGAYKIDSEGTGYFYNSGNAELMIADMVGFNTDYSFVSSSTIVGFYPFQLNSANQIYCARVTKPQPS